MTSLFKLWLLTCLLTGVLGACLSPLICNPAYSAFNSAFLCAVIFVGIFCLCTFVAGVIYLLLFNRFFNDDKEVC